MKRILVSPIFDYPADYFTGDNVAHFLPGKYLWHACNRLKTGIHNPIDDSRIDGPVSLSYIFPSCQPQANYLKRPEWIDEFLVAGDAQEVNRIAKGYDLFINHYRYRGHNPTEVNLGYSPDLNVFNLDLVAYTYKAVYDHGLYVDDLELSDRYAEFLSGVEAELNPERRPVIVIHKRTDDPHDRHLAGYEKLNERLLFEILDTFGDHLVVLAGDRFSWKYYRHPRVKYLTKYINRRELLHRLKEYDAALQYILSSFYCAGAQTVLIGISGFTLFIESIRPRNLMPPVPLFWGPQTFTGIDTCIRNMGWFSPEFHKYNIEHPEDTAFLHQVHHFLYYSREEELLKPYCMDYPNSCAKAMTVLMALGDRYGLSSTGRDVVRGDGGDMFRRLREAAVNAAWTAEYETERVIRIVEYIAKKLTASGRGKSAK